MKKKPQNTPPFNGFAQANTTPVPDVLFDELLSILSGTELKVLLYIIRRTRGFKKDSDAISLNQFQHGIVTKDGKRLDSGCGVSDRTAIVKALKSLEAKKCIFSEKSRTDEGDNATTLYRVFFAPEVVEKSDQGSGKNLPPRSGKIRPGGVVGKSGLPVVENTHPQETVIQQTERTNGTNNSANQKDSLSSIPSSPSSQEKELPTNVEKPSSTQRNTEPLLSAGGQQVRDYWCELGYEDRGTSTTHWNTLSKHVKSLEQMDSLFKHTQVWVNGNPRITDKQVHPGNLVHCLNGWKQAQTPIPETPKGTVYKPRDLAAEMKAMEAKYSKPAAGRN